MSLQLAALLLLEVSQIQMNYINLSNDSKSPGARILQKSSSLLNLFQQILDSRGKLRVVGDATNSVGEDWKENHYMQTKTSKSLLTQIEILLIYICKSISPSTITNLFYQLYLHTLETAPWCAAVRILDVMVGRHGWMVGSQLEWCPKDDFKKVLFSKGGIRQIKSNRPVSWKGQFFLWQFFHVKRLWRCVAYSFCWI